MITVVNDRYQSVTIGNDRDVDFHDRDRIGIGSGSYRYVVPYNTIGTREHTAQAGMDIIDGESFECDRRTKKLVAIRGKLILRKLGPRH